MHKGVRHVRGPGHISHHIPPRAFVLSLSPQASKATEYIHAAARGIKKLRGASLEGKAKFRASTRNERPCFAAERGLDRLGHTWAPDGLEQAHEKNGLVLLQNVAPTPLGTHEHSRVHFLFRAPRDRV